jgi:hypothetical protein
VGVVVKGYGWGVNGGVVRWIDANGAHGMLKKLPKNWKKVAQHPRYPTSFLYMEEVRRG